MRMIAFSTSRLWTDRETDTRCAIAPRSFTRAVSLARALAGLHMCQDQVRETFGTARSDSKSPSTCSGLGVFIVPTNRFSVRAR